MSEQTPENATTETTATVVEKTEEHPPELGDAGKQAIDRMKAERDAARREARTNAEAAKRLQEFEDAKKSEHERLADRQKAVEQERDEARSEGLRYKAAATHKVESDYFDLLGSGTEEEITGRAERVGGLLSELATLRAENEALRAGKPAPARERPVEQLRPGATPGEPQSADDALYASIYGAGAK